MKMKIVANRIGMIAVAVLLVGVCVHYTAAGQIGAIGSIAVSSEPSGADISLDGVPINAVTPYTIQHLDPAKTYTIGVSLEGYQDWSQSNVQVTSGGTSYVHASLTPIVTTGSISISSSPSGANVYLDLDHTYKGITPLTITDVSLGYHSIELELAGYQDWSTSVEVRAGETSYVSATLTPTPPATGSISVSSDPSGARIYVDDSYEGRTPETITPVSPGTHTIKLTRDGYYDWSTSIDVTAGSTSYVSASLTPVPYPTTGSISVSSSPSGAYIHLDGFL